jgi:hypothetical protein
MISISAVIGIIIIHLLGDFVFQTNEMALNKSKSNYWLTLHVLVYTLVTFLGWNFCLLQPSILYSIEDLFKVIILVFTTHWITDYITSRISSKYFEKKDNHNGFLVIGIDQVLHYIQLLCIYHLCVKI